jgi:hypothetical protein
LRGRGRIILLRGKESLLNSLCPAPYEEEKTII